MALFLVLVLPACWYASLSHAMLVGADALSSSSNNEEREEHQESEEGEVAAIGTRPPPPERVERAQCVVVAPVIVPVVTKLVSVAPAPHPSQFSVRRLI